jgi:hypothetical protein
MSGPEDGRQTIDAVEASEAVSRTAVTWKRHVSGCVSIVYGAGAIMQAGTEFVIATVPIREERRHALGHSDKQRAGRLFGLGQLALVEVAVAAQVKHQVSGIS